MQSLVAKKNKLLIMRRELATEWRIQGDNLVPLCKFQIIINIHFFKNLIVFTVNEVNERENICIVR